MADPRTVNEEIFDRLTHHQIGLNRLAAGTAQDMIDALNLYDKRIGRILGRLDAHSTKAQLNKALREFRALNIKAYLDVEAKLKRALGKMATKEAQFQKDTLKQTVPRDAYKQMEVGLPSNKDLRDMVVGSAFNGALLEEHINGLEQGRYNRVRDVVRREVAMGGTDAAVQDAIRKGIIGTKALDYKDGLLDYSRRSLDQKTRTLHNGVAQETRTEFVKENDDIFDGVQWVSVLDNRTSHICMALDGTVFPVDEGPRPPAHPNCRSEVVPIVKDWDAMGLSDLGPGTRESMTGEVPETQTYNEWLKAQTPDVQDDILGPNRGQLFREQGLSVDAFIDDSGRTLTLDELYLEHKDEVYWRPGLYTDGKVEAQWANASPLQTLDEIIANAPKNQKVLAEAMERLTEELGLEFEDPGVKKDRARMEEKIAGYPSPAFLKDVVRGGAVVDVPEQATKIIDGLRKEFQILDEGWKLNSANYFDRKAIVRMRDGTLAELQFWQEDLLAAKNAKGHAMYEDWRKLDPKSDAALKLEEEMRSLYSSVLDGFTAEWKAVLPNQAL